MVIALACLRLCHVGLLWSDEDYHLAAAIRILHGQIPYRDFWYDKPPLAAFYYLFIGGYSGWPLRLLDAAYVLLSCFLIYRLAQSRMAAFLLSFFLAFYLPAAVIPFAPDALLVVPHLAAVYLAIQRRAFWAGACCGIGLAPAVASSWDDCGSSITDRVAMIELATAKPCTREAIFTVWPK